MVRAVRVQPLIGSPGRRPLPLNRVRRRLDHSNLVVTNQPHARPQAPPVCLSEGPLHIEVASVLDQVVASAGQLVCHRFNGDRAQLFARRAIKPATNLRTEADRAQMGSGLESQHRAIRGPRCSALIRFAVLLLCGDHLSSLDLSLGSTFLASSTPTQTISRPHTE